MSEFIEECRREWKRLRVPDPIAEEMAADLAADLQEAEAEGASLEEVLGSSASDPRAFAVSWATERGVVQPRFRDKIRRRSLLLGAAALLVALVAAGLAVAIFTSSQQSHAPTVTGEIRVPSVVGQSLTGAANALQSENFKFRSRQGHSSKPNNVVYQQQPVGNALAPKVSTVTVWVSQGPATVTLPDVRGSLYATAYSQLKNAGFNVRRLYVADNSPFGTVIDESPPGNTPQTPGATITLSVSKGPSTVSVPANIGLQISLAVRHTQAAGLAVKIVFAKHAGLRAGTVVAQAPAAGSEVVRGATVVLVVTDCSNSSKKPCQYP